MSEVEQPIMTEAQNSSGGNPEKALVTEQRASRAVLPVVILILVVIALILGIYNSVRIHRIQGELLHPAEIAQLIAKAPLSAEVEKLRSEITQLNEQEAKAATERGNLLNAYEQLLNERNKGVLGWKLAKVDWLLSSAVQELALTGDVNTALRAVVAADQQLKGIKDPGLLRIRERVSTERAALEAVVTPDLAGMALTLGAMAQGIDALPIVSVERPETSDDAAPEFVESSWRQVLASIWKELKGLVTIRRTDEEIKPLLAPGQEWYLRENLRIKLEQARTALLRQQTEVFHQLLRETETWITRYFDGKAPTVKHALGELRSLQKQSLKPELPEIGTALRELRQWTSRYLDERAAAPDGERDHIGLAGPAEGGSS